MEFAHGNATRNQEQKYVRTCPSVLKKLENRCTNEATYKVYKSEITKIPPASHIPVLQPRNSKQVENIRFKQLQSQRLSHADEDDHIATGVIHTAVSALGRTTVLLLDQAHMGKTLGLLAQP